MQKYKTFLKEVSGDDLSTLCKLLSLGANHFVNIDFFLISYKI